MLRRLSPLLLLAFLAGCVTTGGGAYDGVRVAPAEPGIRWSGPYRDPFYRPYGYYGRPAYGYYGRPAYGYDRPWRNEGRLFRPRRDLVCDRATATCYRDGEIDASDTRDVFGRKAARKVDRLRDAAGTNHIFRPDDDVVCNRRERACYKDGRPDRSETRDAFGKKAAKKLR